MALSSSTFSNLGGAASDLFAAEGFKAKAKGNEFEQKNYLLAAGLSDKAAGFAETSAALKTMQSDRELQKSLGQTTADIGGAGFTAGGSALDIMRDSASQGALAHAVSVQQGLITEEGYKEQGQSYRNMASAAQVAIDAEKDAASMAQITGAIKLAASVATLI